MDEVPAVGSGPSVLHLIDSLAPGGAERSLVDLAPHLLAAGLRLEVAVLHDRPGLGPELARHDVSISVVSGDSRRAWLAGMMALIRGHRPDLVHTTLFDSDVVGRTAAALMRVPVVSSLVSTPYGREHATESGVSRVRLRAAQALDATTARAARRFHAVSREVAGAYEARLRLRPGRVDVIPDGRDLARIGTPSIERRRATRVTLGVDPDTPMVLAVARQEPAKGLDVLLRAVPLLRTLQPAVQVLVAGPEGRATAVLTRLATDLDLVSSVRFLGHREDVADLLCAADVFALPSRREGLPGAVLEAMALEVPVVASDLASVREAVPDEKYAVLVSPESPAVLAQALADVLGDPAGAHLRVRAARAHFAKHFDVVAVSDAMVNFYRRALDWRLT